jgi:hypothetical protein
MELDMNSLPPEIQAKLGMLMGMVQDREPEGEVSIERLYKLNDEVFDIRKKLLKAQYNGAVGATEKLVEGIEKETKQDNKEKTLKMAIVSLESTIDESKKDLMQALMKVKLEARKSTDRGLNSYGEDMDMLDAIIAAAETEANYNPAEVQRKNEQASKPKTSGGGFGFGSNRV